MSNPVTLKTLQDILDYTFTNEALLTQALTHRSFSTTHNERLEFLGDALLSFCIASTLYQTFRGAPEGDMSRMRANLVKGETLAKVARELRLGEFLILGPGEKKSGGKNRDSILANVVEAIIGAVYCDAGIGDTELLVQRLFASRVSALDLNNSGKDPKTRLQEYMQARKQGLPVYTVVDMAGEAHRRTFVAECALSLLEQASQGRGLSRREAEQEAARAALDALGE